MTSDPNESAAWRAFAMLDADAAASFDDAARRNPELADSYREMNCLAAAVAAASVTPLHPRTGQIDRLHARLGLNASKRTNWIGISGWTTAAAAALALILVINHHKQPLKSAAVTPPPQSGSNVSMTNMDSAPVHPDSPPIADPTAAAHAPQHDLSITNPAIEAIQIVKTESKRLIQEIEVLRDKLESAQSRDRMLFDAIPGRAWPVIMQMSPPGLAGETPEIQPIAANGEAAPELTALIADALAGNSKALIHKQDLLTGFEDSANRPAPSAIPIYDAARDNGTLVVNNLPKTLPDESYNLWVTTEGGARPIHVGRLPDSNTAAADSFDFSLGSKAVVPSGFLLTKDPRDGIAMPSESNTVLSGPR